MPETQSASTRRTISFFGTINNLIDDRGEDLRFLRRASHCVSVATLLALGSSAWAQSSGQEQRREANTQGNSTPLAVPATPAREIPVAAPQPPASDTQPPDHYQWIRDHFWEVEWANWALLVAAIWAGRLALRTLKTQTTQIRIGRSALGASRIAADAAKKSADTARTALIADQRPWVPLDVAIAGPLVHEASGSDEKWHIALSYRIKNVGKTPAFAAKVHARAVPWMLGPNVVKDGAVVTRKSTDVERLIGDITEFTDRVKQMMSKFDARILFPQDEDIGHFDVSVDQTLIANVLESPDNYAGHLILVAAVTYRDQFSDNVHTTAKAFHLFKPPWPSGRIDLAGDTVPATDLVLVPYPVHVDKAT